MCVSEPVVVTKRRRLDRCGVAGSSGGICECKTRKLWPVEENLSSGEQYPLGLAYELVAIELKRNRCGSTFAVDQKECRGSLIRVIHNPCFCVALK